MAINSIETFQKLGLATSADKVKPKKQELGQDDFLRLMTAQLTNQDPNKPMENGNFLAQMAQFSSVEGIGRLNDSFSEFANSVTSGQALQAASLVGQSVMIPSDKGVISITKSLSGEVVLNDRTDNLRINISNSNGELVKTLNLGQQTEGQVNFEWDGLLNDGSYVDAGVYNITAEAMVNGENTVLQTYVNADVNSVSLGGSNKGITLDVASLGTVNFNEVKKIF